METKYYNSMMFWNMPTMWRKVSKQK